jgi:hypothetical protein
MNRLRASRLDSISAFSAAGGSATAGNPSRIFMTHNSKRFARELMAAVLVCLVAASARSARGEDERAGPAAPAGGSYESLPILYGEGPYSVAGAPPPTGGSPPITGVRSAVATDDPNSRVEPASASLILPSTFTPYVGADLNCQGPPETVYPNCAMLAAPSDVWDWQVLPQGLIYRSYWAGVKEPRLGIQLMHVTGERSFWDPTAGARVGLLRYGTVEGLHPDGWEWDVEGAAEPRLTLDYNRDLWDVDFRAGTLLTYGLSNWQFKFGYYHLSSHMGDEFAITHPGSLDDRINYVRDSLILGASYFPYPAWRIYGESAWAFHPDGGAEPWEFQFGTELSRPGPTGPNGTPFLALNGHLRQELNFSGDFTAQTGWLWRSVNGQTLRFGLHFYNGKSSQYQTFSKFEQQVGVGLWYDF